MSFEALRLTEVSKGVNAPVPNSGSRSGKMRTKDRPSRSSLNGVRETPF